MNIKKTILFPVIAVFLVFTSCTNEKESISKSIIDSYVQAVQEEDKGMIIETFPRIVYFGRIPKN